jgi:hypothetical protein
MYTEGKDNKPLCVTGCAVCWKNEKVKTTTHLTPHFTICTTQYANKTLQHNASLEV